jgi:hypothetical protein
MRYLATIMLTAALSSCAFTQAEAPGLRYNSTQYDAAVKTGEVQAVGRDGHYILVILPLGVLSWETALADLVSQYHRTPGAVGLRDVRIEHAIGGFLIYHTEDRAYGTIIVDRNSSSRPLQIAKKNGSWSSTLGIREQRWWED